MSVHQLAPEFINRFREYLASKEYAASPAYSKSEYWQYQSGVIRINISDTIVTLNGQSGLYVPSANKIIVKGILKRAVAKIIRVIRAPSRLVTFIREKMGDPNAGCPASGIRLLNYFKAFDKVMKSDLVSDPDISPYRINFKRLKEKPGVIISIKDMQRKFFAKHRYDLSPLMVVCYYFYNILLGYINLAGVRTVLEIGAGSGNLAALLGSTIGKSTIIIVDLPETLCLSIIFIAELFPHAKILLPNESGREDFDDYDYVFLTPNQIQEIKDNSVDLAINAHAFQEMTRRQTEEYFQLIQRCCKNKAYYFTSNRVEKIPCGPDSYEKETSEPPQRFSDYPWNRSNQVMIYEICRLRRLTSLDNVFIRLEQICK